MHTQIRITILIMLLSYCTISVAQVQIKRHAMLMGSAFDITLVGKDTLETNKNIDLVIAEIDRIENLISEWRPQTQISLVNQNAGVRPVKVDQEVFELTKRAIHYSIMTEGAFDISIAALDKIWVFDGSMIDMPSIEVLKKSIQNVGYKHIILDSIESTIYLLKKGMKIGFGSIGKGYAADTGREFMKKIGISGGIVNASGDLSTWGSQYNATPWVIGINNPFRKNRIIRKVKINEGSIATSGNYVKFVEIAGKRYSHIINPKTGMPVSGLTSVTIYGPSCEFANALSTSIMVMGKHEGIRLLKKHSDYSYLIITDEGKTISNIK